jgi:GNAT superfamily N-acetyltransferase
MDHIVRSVRPEEWSAVKELRLAALQDPAAPLAFLETYEDVASRLDVFWMQRTARGAAQDSGVRQLIAEAPDGDWSGTVTVILEEPGSSSFFGGVVEQRQGVIVGVYVRPQYRGSGLIEALMEAALEWSWSQGVERVRLFVDERNGRAESAYRKSGFVRSGETYRVPGNDDAQDIGMVVRRP